VNVEREYFSTASLGITGCLDRDHVVPDKTRIRRVGRMDGKEKVIRIGKVDCLFTFCKVVDDHYNNPGGLSQHVEIIRATKTGVSISATIRVIYSICAFSSVYGHIVQ
jgi:hypothetical protein